MTITFLVVNGIKDELVETSIPSPPPIEQIEDQYFASYDDYDHFMDLDYGSNDYYDMVLQGKPIDHDSILIKKRKSCTSDDNNRPPKKVKMTMDDQGRQASDGIWQGPNVILRTVKKSDKDEKSTTYVQIHSTKLLEKTASFTTEKIARNISSDIEANSSNSNAQQDVSANLSDDAHKLGGSSTSTSHFHEILSMSNEECATRVLCNIDREKLVTTSLQNDQNTSTTRRNRHTCKHDTSDERNSYCK